MMATDGRTALVQAINHLRLFRTVDDPLVVDAQERLRVYDATYPTTVPAEYAWVRLQRLCGCNYRQQIERRGRSVYVRDPQGTHQYRIDAAKYDAGERQFRDSWCISQWDAKADRTTEAEHDWQD